METKIQKWGNSIGVRISKDIALQAHLKEGMTVDVGLYEGKVIVRPVTKPKKYTITEMVSRITDSNRHDLEDYGGSLGGELL